jgi:ribosomal protein S18 acetylase RimI-like enzyme
VVAVRHDARRRGIGRALVQRALDDLRLDGTRLVVAELAGSAENAPALQLLAACGFREEGAIADYYREGVPLLVLEHRFE